MNVAEYDEAEKAAVRRLPNLVTGAFLPEFYTSRAYDQSQLWRHMDAMHEGRKEYNWGLLGGLTADEFLRFCRITKCVDSLAQNLCDRRMQATTTLLRAIYQARLVTAFNPASVLEVGPGSGYLGAMLMLAGYRYSAVEVSQAFYLCQSNLWEAVGLRPHVHFTWWQWADEMPTRAELVTANHVLCEMHPYAVGFLAYRAKGIGMKNLILDSWGLQRIPSESVIRKFKEFGYSVSDFGKEVHCFGQMPDFAQPDVTVSRGLVEEWLVDHFDGAVPGNPCEAFLEKCKIRTV